ncbi:MAG: hypothetical protein AVDCRST_MAG76-3370 [uncultured Acidimicrobiales bacterium]|uniref:Uncharacterized protein n=1 Tax=uncultured Acidimicrobiales bacterium TaxID=310071 RepID=A0A6J4J6S2_9ACTN|nr:MAG: hypothetical protein AVDCRST_MAG76-3370 [uncultured Acidimicrobiales bacterium]
MEADDEADHGVQPGPAAAERAEKAFVAGLIARGEAAQPDEHGRLPAGATHELVEDDEGNVTVKRRRFSAF